VTTGSGQISSGSLVMGSSDHSETSGSLVIGSGTGVNGQSGAVSVQVGVSMSEAGPLTVVAGDNLGNIGQGGILTLGSGTGALGGNIEIISGKGLSQSGGSISIIGGEGLGVSSSGGSISIEGGSSLGNGAGGELRVIIAGSRSSDLSGFLVLSGGDGSISLQTGTSFQQGGNLFAGTISSFDTSGSFITHFRKLIEWSFRSNYTCIRLISSRCHW